MLEEVEVELKYHPRPFCLQPPGFAQAFSFCECEGWGGLGLEKLMLINHCLKNLRILCRYVSQVLHHHHHHHHATFGQHIYSQECYQIKVLVFVLGVNPTWCMVGAPSSGDHCNYSIKKFAGKWTFEQKFSQYLSTTPVLARLPVLQSEPTMASRKRWA